jgi:RNA-splicing ligase RtcB
LELIGALAAGHGGVAAGATASRPTPSRFILRQTETDDIEAYLQTFERTAVRENWDPEQCAILLAPFLSGTAQKAYQDMTANHNYEWLKKEMLRR